MISDYTRLALRNMRKRRLRSWLTVLGIIISIATIFILISISLGLRSAVEEQFRILGTDKFFIQPKGQLAGPGTTSAATLTEEDIEVIEKVQGIRKVTYYIVSPVKVEYSGQIRFMQVVGFPLESGELFIENGAYTLNEGRFLREGDKGEIDIGYQYKYSNLFKKPVKINDYLELNGNSFKVRAIMNQRGNPFDDRAILMSLDDFREIFPEREGIDQVIVQVDSAEKIDEIANRVEKRLRSFRGVDEKTQDFSILKPEELLGTFGNILNILTAFLIGVAAISLLVGGIGIVNTMYASVLERTREIGVMKAVGAQNRDILLLFLIEAGLLGITGGIIGIILGFGVAKLIAHIAVVQLGTNLLQVAAPFYLIMGCLLFAFLAGAVAGLWPAWRASKIKTVDALRYE